MDAPNPPRVRHASGHQFGRRWSVVAAAAALVAILAACSGSASTPLQGVGGPVGGTTNEGGTGAQPANPVPSAAPAAAGDYSKGPSAVTSQVGAADSALIIKTGTLTLEVDDVGKAVDAARAAVASVGGYVSASQRSNDGDKARASVTYRIPAGRWEDALAALRKVGSKVVDEQTNAVEVTGQVLDLGARITNLQATEAALQGIMARATKIPDVLAVEQQLSDVQGQIEQLSTQKAHLQDQAALSSLTVNFGLHTVAVAEVTKTWDPASEVDRAVAAIVGIAQGLVVAAVWFAIVWLPVLLALGILAFLLWAVLRRAGLVGRPPQGRGPVLPASPVAPES